MTAGGKLIVLSDLRRKSRQDKVVRYLKDLSREDLALVLRLVTDEASRRIEGGK